VNDPRIDDELKEAAPLYRFYLEQPDAAEWTDAEIAQKLGVSDRTIRRYRGKIIPFARRALVS
jgi:DNA-binding transcriptional regulator LsrR (DeoR family)